MATQSTRGNGPLQVVPRSILAILTGRPVYPRQRVNRLIHLTDGHTYRVFREVLMRDNPPQASGGVFRVWFYTVLPVWATILLSNMTKLFFFGMPGFRGKMWVLNDSTREFGGIYQFDNVELAQAYAESFAMALSKRRARPGMFAVEVYGKAGEDSLFCAQTASITVPVLQPAPPTHPRTG